MAQAFSLSEQQAPNPMPQESANKKAPDSKKSRKHKKNSQKGTFNRLLVSRKEKDYLVENLSMLIGSGLNMVEVLQAIGKELRTRTMKNIVKKMQEDVDAGSPLWKTIDDSRLFEQHVIQLIRVGEQSGRLAENLKTVAEQEEKDRKFRSKVRSALLYPVFVLSLTVALGVGIAWFVLPRLSSIFSSLNLTLPIITRALIAVGDFLGAYGYIVIPATILIIILVFYFVFFNRTTKEFGQEILFRMPGVKRLIQEVEIARFGFLLGTLLKAGLPISEALDSVQRATIARGYKKLFQYLNSNISAGSTFKSSFQTFPNTKRLIPTPMQQLVIAGEGSGNLPDTLLKMSEIYEAKTEITTKNLAVILEPILLVIVWLGVLAVALAVIIPLYGLLGGLGQ